MRGFLTLVANLLTLSTFTLAFPQPEKTYGVNIGSWLLIEPWMLPDEWVSMGGQICDNCSTCIMSEYELAKANPNTADQIFDKHWQSWFTQDDVQRLKGLGINTVRIPIGYWLVEPLVEAGEFYPKGGMRRLRQGLKWLKDAGIAVILDHHALPGVSSPGQMFAGRCTQDVQFYNQKNYHRALIWTAVMTFYSHVDPNFGSVYSIQAINEPIMDASKTPGYGQFQKDFVQTVRAVEDTLGIMSEDDFTPDGDMTTTLQKAVGHGECSDEIKSVLKDSIPVLLKMLLKYGGADMLHGFRTPCPEPLTTNFMDVSWQWGNRSNPADAADGPQSYDNHLYYSFGGVADHNPDAYLTHNCNLDRVETDKALGNTPLFFGEWSLAVGFNATDQFMKQWGDAQKLAYGKSSGWIFWNFKLEDSKAAGIYPKQWSYYKVIELGYMTKDPAAYFDPNVCAKYIKPKPPAGKRQHVERRRQANMLRGI